jgi:hypothetical protein
MSDVFEKVMDLAKRRGFIWPTSECYGAVAGFIDYGPLGAMMKRRVENIWRDFSDSYCPSPAFQAADPVGHRCPEGGRDPGHSLKRPCAGTHGIP